MLISSVLLPQALCFALIIHFPHGFPLFVLSNLNIMQYSVRPHSGLLLLDHNALTFIVSFNLSFFPTTRTLYLSIPSLILVISLQSSCFISDGERRKRLSKLTRIRVWSVMTGWGSSVDLVSWQTVYSPPCH